MILIPIPKYKIMDRKIALDILLKYVREKSYLNLTINETFSHLDLSRESKDFITRVVYGTVQYWLYLEYMLEPFINNKTKNFEKTLLLMSLYQHYFMDSIPDYAIVHESVELAKKKKGQATARFVNAVLKQAFVSRRSLDDLDDTKRLSIETSHPLWLVKMLMKQYGLEEAQKILRASNDIPLRTARVNTLKITREELIAQNHLFEKGQLSEDAIYYKGSHIASTDEFQHGLITIQDESSQLVARLLNPKPHDYVLDMCCAPGSKTSHLAILMQNVGCIDAYDLYEHKVPLVEKQMERLGVSIVNVKSYDSTHLIDIYPQNIFDKILLDAPCSGFGVLARKPEIKYHDSSAMDEIIQIQAKLLENAYALLKNGGNIVYSTCTINKKENEKQIDAFLKKYPHMKKIEEKTILPYQYHSDGFYMCLLKKEL